MIKGWSRLTNLIYFKLILHNRDPFVVRLMTSNMDSTSHQWLPHR